ncbi:hypothetical protein COOONC_03068 [Cooperia oncophora]
MLMNDLAMRYNGSTTVVEVEKMKDVSYMIDQLRSDTPDDVMFGCVIEKYAGGVLFKQFDTQAGKLDYALLMPTEFIDEDPWHLDQEWNDPFGVTADRFRIPVKPPYWGSGFLTLQYAIDSLFIEASSSNVTLSPELRLRRLPEAAYETTTMAAFFGYSSYFWGLCVFVLVIHTAREIASERSTVKDFLSVMGLSTPVFYLSHVLYASIKCFLVLLVCAIPLSTKLGPVSMSLFLVTIILYGISAVVFATLISSLFKSPNTVLKGRELSWSNCFEEASFRFTAGAALVMLVVDIIWMGIATLFFDFMFSDSEVTFFKRPFGHKYLSSSATKLALDKDINETDEGLQKTRVGISVQRLMKIWFSSGERAVDGMSLEAYVGQVCYLNHITLRISYPQCYR